MRAGEARMRQKPVHRAVEIAAIARDRRGDKIDDVLRHVEGRVTLARGRDSSLQDTAAQSLVESADLDAQPSGQPRLDALIETFEIARRAVGRDHHLPAL